MPEPAPLAPEGPRCSCWIRQYLRQLRLVEHPSAPLGKASGLATAHLHVRSATPGGRLLRPSDSARPRPDLCRTRSAVFADPGSHSACGWRWSAAGADGSNASTWADVAAAGLARTSRTWAGAACAPAIW